jgi:4-azaleucine resistance transporter AzlC
MTSEARDDRGEVPQGATLTLDGVRAGMRRIVPLALGTSLFGLAFGVAGREIGLSFAEAVLMSGLVWAGTAQFAALEIGGGTMALLPALLACLAVNARFLLLGAALRPWFSGLPPHKAYGALALMSDGNWALAMGERARGNSDAGLLVGAGALMWLSWVASTAGGHLLGSTLADPESWGIDFVAVVFFVTMLAAMTRGRSDVFPWLVAAVVATATALLAPGHWYILAGGLSGSLAGALRDGA